MRLPVEAKLDAVVAQALARHPISEARRAQEVDGTLLEHPRPHPMHHVFLAAPLERDRLHSLEMEEMREHQASGPAADDGDARADDVGAHRCSPNTASSSRKALFAAGTPQ